MLKDIVIRSLASDAAYEQGTRLARQGAVQEFTQEQEKPPVYAAKVLDANGTFYHPRIRLSGNGANVEHYTCDCPAARTFLGACRHAVALMQATQGEALAAEQPSVASAHLFKYYAENAAPAATAAPVPVHLLPRLQVQQEYGKVTKWLEFRLQSGRSYVIQNLLQFVRTVLQGGTWELGRSQRVRAEQLFFDDAISQALWALLRETYEGEAELLSYSSAFQYYHALNKSYVFSGKAFKLTPTAFHRFLGIMGETSFDMRIDGDEVGDVHVAAGNPAIEVAVEQTATGGRLRLQGDPGLVLDEDYHYIYQQGIIYATDATFAQQARPLYQTFNLTARINLNQNELGRFFSQVLPSMEDTAAVQVDRSFAQTFLRVPLAVELYIEYYQDGIAVQPLFRYDTLTFNPLRERPMYGQEKLLVRDARAEQQVQDVFVAYDFTVQGDQYVQPDADRAFDFLTEAVPALPAHVAVFYADTVLSNPVRHVPHVRTGVSVNDDNLLEITFDTRGLDVEELMDILSDYRQRRRYHRLKDGTFLTLQDQQLAALADFTAQAGVTQADLVDGKAVKPLSQALYLDELAQEDARLDLARSQAFQKVVRDIRQPQLAPAIVPASLQGVLRDYQVTGFKWLSQLASYHFGGILADDMGLGKTLQVTAFLLAQKEQAAQADNTSWPPSLVVAPTSLVYNWQDEVQRFAPQLQVAVIAGTKRERQAQLATACAAPVDIVVTTYNLLKRDIELYGSYRFHYVILDEAQHIKNPETQNARAVKRLQATGWFALTGTPIENTLTELWSIFDFLMPGYLGNHRQFKQHYEIPIVRERELAAGDTSEPSAHAQRELIDLRRRIQPFVLRRLKKDVLTELPDKVETRLLNEMTTKQAKVYKAYFLQSQKEFAQTLAEHGFNEGRLRILAILTRLRQIACDPSLFLESWEGGSGKLDQLVELVTEALAGGHRLLIFSQFTQMLARIRARLATEGLTCSYLDGSTPAQERLELVKAFNAGGAPIFLISLKAGGTGLNLTGADMVIHFDPWWNPAVEDQATDRAYRLGQEHKVQVVKLITKGTVEEKIYALQAKKKNLIDQMIQPGGSFLSKLSEAEIRSLFQK